ncbi:Alkaline phosphatase synthesis sensor protein PhoR [compost metagenome]
MTSQGIEAEIEIPQDPLYAHANESAIDRILDNLISNAIRYGSEGKTLGIRLRHDEHWLYIEVWDRGKGIHEIHQSRVFERMYTLEDSRNKLYQGSGLGLTITKRLVQNMGGDITLYSRAYDKTVFTVQLKRLNY